MMSVCKMGLVMMMNISKQQGHIASTAAAVGGEDDHEKKRYHGQGQDQKS